MRAIRPLAAAVLALAASLAAAQSTPPAAGQPLPRTQSSRESRDLLDINTATPQQLKALPGFGDAYVRRVIAGRPYSAKNQLVTRGVLPQSAYDKISSTIVAHRPPK